MTMPGDPDRITRADVMPGWVRLIGVGAAAILTIVAIFLVRGEEATSMVVTGAWMRATPPGVSTAAGYLTITNESDTPDRLIDIDSGIAPRIELHRTTIANGIASMAPVEVLEIPAHGSVVFAPGGNHVMLNGLVAPLFEGDSVDLALTFETAGRLVAQIEVLPSSATGPETPAPEAP